MSCLNLTGYAESHAKLTVKEVLPEKIPSEIPTFEEPLSNLQVEHGSEVLLRCKVVGLPTPEIVWLYNNNNLATNNKFRDASVFYNEREAVVRLGRAAKNLEGSYTCKAVNAAGAATSTW